MSRAAAYSPSHITGFFEILDRSGESSERGSRGAGISLSKGVTTEVSLRKSNSQSVKIRINGKLTRVARVSKYVTKIYQERVNGNHEIEINHHFDVPIGTGFGTSGAGALSLSLALNRALKLNLSTVEASQVAHQAEVESRTGLGTVIAETYGGMEARLKPGAPGIGRIMEIPFDEKMEVYAAGFGPISTTHVLSTPWMREKINGHAQEFLWDLLAKPNAGNFMRLSREFSNGIGLATRRVKGLLSIFDNLGIEASTLMMGEGVFCILPAGNAERIDSHVRETQPSVTFSFSSPIAPSGAQLLDS